MHPAKKITGLSGMFNRNITEKFKCKRKIKRHRNNYTNVRAEESTDLYKDKIAHGIDMVCFVQRIYTTSEI